MCGRYSLISDLAELAARFEFDAASLRTEPSYNVAPTQQVLTVLESDEGRRAGFMRWGLIPFWAKDPSIGARMINARAETVAERPSFRRSLRRRRCLVLADGFYEWQRTNGGKRPMRILLKTGEPFAFAGLWDTWRNPEGERVASCSIITTVANELLAPIHPRMPVILDRESEAAWLDPAFRDPAPLTALLQPHPPETMHAYQVSPLVNNARNNTAEVLARAGG